MDPPQGTKLQPGQQATLVISQGPPPPIAFVRNGPAVNGQINWILGAAFCRESASPIPSSELQFIADAVQVRG